MNTVAYESGVFDNLIMSAKPLFFGGILQKGK